MVTKLGESLNTYGERLQQLRYVHRTYKETGQHVFSEYNFGMWNGLELALSLVEGRQPHFEPRPERFTEDNTVTYDGEAGSDEQIVAEATAVVRAEASSLPKTAEKG